MFGWYLFQQMCEDEFDKKRQQVSSLNGSDDGDLKAILYKFESVSNWVNHSIS